MAPKKVTTATGDEVDEGENGNGRDYGYRLSITIDPSLRRNMRLAAAMHDMSIGEWAAAVLEKAADKATEGMPTLKSVE